MRRELGMAMSAVDIPMRPADPYRGQDLVSRGKALRFSLLQNCAA